MRLAEEIDACYMDLAAARNDLVNALEFEYSAPSDFTRNVRWPIEWWLDQETE